MDFFIVEPVFIIDSTIPEHTDETGTVYPVWSNTSTYAVDTTVSSGGKLYQALRNIYPLATYSWNDIASGSTPIVTKLSDKTNVTATSVPCVKDVTVVYVEDTWKTGGEAVIGKFFLFTGTSGDIDFTTIDPSSPANFSQILNYRYQDLTPADNPLSWGYVGATNRNRCVDTAYTSQSVYTGTSVSWDINLKGVGKLALFNIETPACKIELFDLADLVTPFYTEGQDNLLDMSRIVNWRTLTLYDPVFKSNIDFSLPFYSGTIRCRITFYSAVSSTFKLGEILVGKNQHLALTMDGVPVQVKTSAKITEKDNGDIILENEGDITKVFLIYNFTLKFNTVDFDLVVDKCTEIINRRVVVTAESSGVTMRTLVVYGFIREASPSYKSHSSKNEITLQIQRFK